MEVFMSKTGGMSFALSLACLFFAPAVLLGQRRATPTPAALENVPCEPGICVSKVFYLPDFTTPYELQDVENMFRIILEATVISKNQTEHAVSLQGNSEQIAIAEKLTSTLESFRSSRGHDRSSVLVYEPLPNKISEQPTRCELTTCFIKALYLPDFSIRQLQDALNKLHFTAHIARICMIPSSHAIVFEGTSKQLALAEGQINEYRVGQAPSTNSTDPN